jgi:hypothetical protein
MVPSPRRHGARLCAFTKTRQTETKGKLLKSSFGFKEVAGRARVSTLLQGAIRML